MQNGRDTAGQFISGNTGRPRGSRRNSAATFSYVNEEDVVAERQGAKPISIF